MTVMAVWKTQLWSHKGIISMQIQSHTWFWHTLILVCVRLLSDIFTFLRSNKRSTINKLLADLLQIKQLDSETRALPLPINLWCRWQSLADAADPNTCGFQGPSMVAPNHGSFGPLGSPSEFATSQLSYTFSRCATNHGRNGGATQSRANTERRPSMPILQGVAQGNHRSSLQISYV